ncbi:hypothetical protein CL622_05845 [archaeon]|nr:hypothetical protein [archaeon]|tara:strand:- start:271 stop:453 length:183 start_codon:yes stop_codon:yes gene_type:complete
MANQNQVKSAGLLILFAGLLHLTRSVAGWSLVVGGYAVPMWISWLAVIITGYLSYNLLKK